MNSKNYQTKLRSHRLVRELSQEALAAKVGCTRNTIARIERGTEIPRVTVALMIAKALDVGVEEIFTIIVNL